MVRHFGRISVLLVAGLAATFAFGQNANTGEIKGTVSDASGAVVAGVTVTITNVQTGVATVITTNSAGIYDAPSIPVGQYRMTFSKTGFRDFVRDGITLQIQTLGVDATLQVGKATEQVVVTGEPPLVETETSEQHVDINTAAIHNAPIIGTDWRAEMIQLIPGREYRRKRRRRSQRPGSRRQRHTILQCRCSCRMEGLPQLPEISTAATITNPLTPLAR